MTEADLSLESRAALPDALRVLLTDYPRAAWEADPNFSQLIRFWLDRHIMFRRMMALLQDETDTLLDAGGDPMRYAGALSRVGSRFVGELHGHHQIEDAHYFPKLRSLDARLDRGFDVLDKDHHAIDGHLEAFVGSANDALKALGDGGNAQDSAASMRPALARLERFLDRHLEDEEELIVPVLLKFAPAGLV